MRTIAATLLLCVVLGAYAETAVFLDARPDWMMLHDKAVALARQNVETIDGWQTQMTCMPGVGKIWTWDSCYMALFAGLTPEGCDGLGNLDNLYRLQSPDGYVSMAYEYATRRPAFGERVNPPLFAWCEWQYARRTGNTSRLPRAYDAASRLYRWLKANRIRTCNGLYWFEDTGSSGMDNSPRSGYSAEHQKGSDVCFVDLCCQQVLAARCLAKIAPLVGKADETAKWLAEAETLAESINRLMWCERTGFYHDVYIKTDNKLAVKTAAAFWALVSGVATGSRAAKLAAHLENPATFGTKYPVPSLSADDPNFREDGGYWLGSVWPPIVYMAVCGLRECGRRDLARKIAVRHLDQMAATLTNTTPSTIWECYRPNEAGPAKTAKGEDVRPDFVGWGGLGPLVMLVEDVIGLDVDAISGVVDWHLSERGRQGVTDLQFGGGRLSLCARIGVKGHIDELKVKTNRKFRLRVSLSDGRSVTEYEIKPTGDWQELNGFNEN